MDREVLFRGKRVDNGEWVEGFYWKDIWGDNTAYIFYDGEDYEVIPETVGQYIGITDKNGMKIFVGDIVKRDKIRVVRYDPQSVRFVFANPEDDTVSCFMSCYNQEIIGNSYDNPELLCSGKVYYNPLPN